MNFSIPTTDVSIGRTRFTTLVVRKGLFIVGCFGLMLVASPSNAKNAKNAKNQTVIRNGAPVAAVGHGGGPIKCSCGTTGGGGTGASGGGGGPIK